MAWRIRRGYRSMMAMSRTQMMASGKSCCRGKLDLMLVLILAGFRNMRDGIEQRSHQPVQFRVRDEMRRLLPSKRPAEHDRKTQHRAPAPRQPLRRVVFAEQFTLHAKYCRLQGHEIHVGGGQRTLH